MVTYYEVTDSLHVACDLKSCSERATHVVFCRPLDLWVSCHTCKKHLREVVRQMSVIEESEKGDYYGNL